MTGARPVGRMIPTALKGQDRLYRTTDEEARAIRDANVRTLRKAGNIAILAEIYPDLFCPICGDERAPVPRYRTARRDTCGREACRRASISEGRRKAWASRAAE